MTSPRRPGRRPRSLTRVGAWLLALLAAVGLLVFSAGTASAVGLPNGQTRVGASAPETITAVGVSEHIAAGQGRGPPLWQPQTAVATGVAAEAGGAVVDVAARRVTLRVGTKKSILDAQRAPDGKWYDPNTGVEIPEGGGQFGHRPGFEWRRTQQTAREQGWTRQQVIEYENDPSHYWYEDPSSNMSHRYEMP